VYILCVSQVEDLEASLLPIGVVVAKIQCTLLVRGSVGHQTQHINFSIMLPIGRLTPSPCARRIIHHLILPTHPTIQRPTIHSLAPVPTHLPIPISFLNPTLSLRRQSGGGNADLAAGWSEAEGEGGSEEPSEEGGCNANVSSRMCARRALPSTGLVVMRVPRPAGTTAVAHGNDGGEPSEEDDRGVPSRPRVHRSRPASGDAEAPANNPTILGKVTMPSSEFTFAQLPPHYFVCAIFGRISLQSRVRVRIFQ
jgi:hypothetical protein